jgi:hypothetical protein
MATICGSPLCSSKLSHYDLNPSIASTSDSSQSAQRRSRRRNWPTPPRHPRTLPHHWTYWISPCFGSLSPQPSSLTVGAPWQWGELPSSMRRERDNLGLSLLLHTTKDQHHVENKARLLYTTCVVHPLPCQSTTLPDRRVEGARISLQTLTDMAVETRGKG